MRTIKKYANRKLYDMTAKRYISMKRVAELIRDGEAVEIIDNQTGEDITAAVASQLLSKSGSSAKSQIPAGILFQFLRKGSGTLSEYAKRYVGLLQNAMTMAEEEVDRLVAMLVKDREISESEGRRLKRDIQNYADNIRQWMGAKIDRRIDEVLDRMHLASKDQVRDLAAQVAKLTRKVEKLEKRYRNK